MNRHDVICMSCKRALDLFIPRLVRDGVVVSCGHCRSQLADHLDPDVRTAWHLTDTDRRFLRSLRITPE